jgi:Na+/H+ antiporter NhaD/arsenite permease-like protein
VSAINAALSFSGEKFEDRMQEVYQQRMHIDLNFSVIILALVFILISVRQLGGIRLQIWQIMSLGALAVLLTAQISFADAIRAINLDVMIFLLGMFIIGESMHKSGYLLHLSYRLFRRAKNLDHLLLLILFGMGILSAFLMNDTLAIIGTPLMLYFARTHGVPAKLLLLALAFAVTTGSVMSPIGNPQNLLIALNSGISNPFLLFSKFLLLPTLVNLLLAYLLLRIFYRGCFQEVHLNHFREPLADTRLAFLSKISFCLLIILILIKIIVVLLGSAADFRLTYIAVISALPIIVFSSRRAEVIRDIDWHTLIFFIAMFILMEGVWDSGIFQSYLAATDTDMTSVPVILVLSVAISQLISNVPFVALFLPLMEGAPGEIQMALAAGSTIAGNLFILGAASNVIIIQNAEKGGETLTFLEFARIGIPLTALNILVYWFFL